MSVRRVLFWPSRLRTAVLSVTLGLLACASALGHGIPIDVDVDNGKLVVTTGETLHGLRVVFDEVQEFNASGFTSAPGWDFSPALQNTTIKLQVLDKLFFWDKNSGFAGTTPASLIGRRFFGTPDQFEVNQAGIVDGESIVWDADALAAGTHHIERYEVPPSAPDGAYGLLIRLEQVIPSGADFQSLGAALYSPSDPLLLVFNQGLGSVDGPNGEPSEYQQGVNAIAGLASVPEPASAVAFAIGAVVLGAGLWRSRRSK